MTTTQAPAQALLPHLVEHRPGGPDLIATITARRAELRRRLLVDGALLLRGFPVGGVAGFEDAVRALSGEPLRYAERSSPRSTIAGNVYTSTDYPPDEEIFLHNENSYQASWPRLLYFYCDVPAETQGATPLADVREVHRLVDPQVRAEFERRGWQAVRNFHPGFGVPWSSVFNTGDRAAVDAYCAERGIRTEWTGEDGLRTVARREAVHTHPETGERVWFNHITFFHHSTLAPDVAEGLLELFGEDGLPSNTYYGDGAPIPREVTDHLRDCYRKASRRFDYRQDDILVVDNMLAAHGREPFTGPRRIAVAMTDLYDPAAATGGPGD
ncbi:TauD/TfdA family dioxygenase [Kitasatospora cineracea]|uniref:TfdA family taurine catabolism dioxygenase TauD n=1 Tax=Kitasatospora cineracea TaxID=88074 RepID=A0A8G1UEM7_9ACTN|nr:TauD/TfdA family dioxygenase [Kitasatospora cineracea]ROR42578.1 TfdA family taurine catabolism dioxygenase TauD [Kitasatospora cineracea]